MDEETTGHFSIDSSVSCDCSAQSYQQAFQDVTQLILDMRDEYMREERAEFLRTQRRCDLYEKTLGFAVIPILLRRTCIRVARRARAAGESRE